MSQNLDFAIQTWLERLSKKWKRSIDEISDIIAAEEIENRYDYYPRIERTLKNIPFNIDDYAKETTPCFVLSDRFDRIRLNQFTKNRIPATTAITTFIKNFPDDDQNAKIRIDDFIDQTAECGYVTSEKKIDKAGAGQLASVILTSIFPNRFVDFRAGRWKPFAEKFNYSIKFPDKGSIGEKIIWAGKFADEFSKTNTFQQYWFDEEYPLWIVASLSWVGIDPKDLFIEECLDPDDDHEWGEKYLQRLHRKREDNRIVRKAKAKRFKKDPLLHCDVCGFSFVEKYGLHGHNFIEAHHTKPISSLKKGDKTRIQDIALICGNCHDMIHKGKYVNRKKEMLALKELIDKIQK